MTERKGIYKIVTDAEERSGSGGTGLPGTRWQVFWALFKSRFGALVKINLLMLLFALPVILVYFLYVNQNSITLAALPFSSNGGAGYPYFDDIVSVGKYAVFENSLTLLYLLIPALIIAGIGLAGGFHAVGQLFGGENIPVTKTFFKGVKRNAWQFALITALASASIVLTVFFACYLPVSTLKPFWNVFLMILIVLLLMFTLFFVMYLFTQVQSYKIRFWPLVKNSFAFAAGKFVSNALFLIISVLPLSSILLLSGNAFTSFLILFVLGLLAFSFLTLMWTIHTRGVYGGFFGGWSEAEVITAADKDVKGKERAAEPAAVTAGISGTAQTGAARPAPAAVRPSQSRHKGKSKKKRGKK